MLLNINSFWVEKDYFKCNVHFIIAKIDFTLMSDKYARIIKEDKIQYRQELLKLQYVKPYYLIHFLIDCLSSAPFRKIFTKKLRDT